SSRSTHTSFSRDWSSDVCSSDLIEEKITKKTSAILATHVFGNPCDVEAIEQIAKKHNLKVIYDAAHSFGVTYKDKSIFNYGDVRSEERRVEDVYRSLIEPQP